MKTRVDCWRILRCVDSSSRTPHWTRPPPTCSSGWWSGTAWPGSACSAPPPSGRSTGTPPPPARRSPTGRHSSFTSYFQCQHFLMETSLTSAVISFKCNQNPNFRRSDYSWGLGLASTAALPCFPTLPLLASLVLGCALLQAAAV